MFSGFDARLYEEEGVKEVATLGTVVVVTAIIIAIPLIALWVNF